MSAGLSLPSTSSYSHSFCVQIFSCKYSTEGHRSRLSNGMNQCCVYLCCKWVTDVRSISVCCGFTAFILYILAKFEDKIINCHLGNILLFMFGSQGQMYSLYPVFSTLEQRHGEWYFMWTCMGWLVYIEMIHDCSFTTMLFIAKLHCHCIIACIMTVTSDHMSGHSHKFWK